MKGKAGRTQEFLSRTAAVNSRGSEQDVACSGCSRGTAHRALTAPAAQQLCSVPAFPAHTHTRPATQNDQTDDLENRSELDIISS